MCQIQVADDPGLTSSGKPQKVWKMIVVMLFDKNADGDSGSKGKGKAKVRTEIYHCNIQLTLFADDDKTSSEC